MGYLLYVVGGAISCCDKSNLSCNVNKTKSITVVSKRKHKFLTPLSLHGNTVQTWSARCTRSFGVHMTDDLRYPIETTPFLKGYTNVCTSYDRWRVRTCPFLSSLLSTQRWWAASSRWPPIHWETVPLSMLQQISWMSRSSTRVV